MDLTLCTNVYCPKFATCYRNYMTHPQSTNQSYANMNLEESDCYEPK